MGKHMPKSVFENLQFWTRGAAGAVGVAAIARGGVAEAMVECLPQSQPSVSVRQSQPTFSRFIVTLLPLYLTLSLL